MSAWNDVAGAHARRSLVGGTATDSSTAANTASNARRSLSTAGGAPLPLPLKREISHRTSQSNPLWDEGVASAGAAHKAAVARVSGTGGGGGGPRGRVYLPRRADQGAPVPVPLPAGPHPDEVSAAPLPVAPHPDDVARRARERAAKVERLPAGWEEFACDDSGQAYFFHAASSTTTWIRPTELQVSGRKTDNDEATL